MPGSRHAASALVTTTVGVLPSSLFAGLAPLIRADLGFEARWVGVSVGVYFATSSVASLHAGRLAERLGSQRAMWTGVTISAASLLAIGMVADSLASLWLLLAFAGLGNATIQPAANLALARGVDESRRGLAFGFKQAAVPMASALGGFAVPVLGVTLGWRAAFVGAAVLALLALRLPLPDPPSGGPGRQGARGLGSVGRTLVLLAAGIGLGSAAANGMTAYLAEASIDAGWTAAQAGTILGMGGVCGIVARIAVGWYSDRMLSGRLRLVAWMMAVGGIGYGWLMFLDRPVVLALAVPLAFAAGWGYNGLFIYAVVRLHPHAPAAATGVTQVGAFGGAVFGPPVFGLVADLGSYPAAWLLMALFSVTAALLIFLAHRRVVLERALPPGAAHG